MKSSIEQKQRLRHSYETILETVRKTDYEEKGKQYLKSYDTISEDDKIKIVVCGEWSTGKSTLIKALTSREDIKTGEDIETTKVTSYNYNDFYIVDTPGFCDIKEHSELAKKALINADRVIYCITAQQLFDEGSIKDYKDLIDLISDKTPLLIAITKFGIDGNNSIDCMKNIRYQTEDVLEENGLNQVDMTCINAELYIEGINENNTDKINASYFDVLKNKIDTLCDNSTANLCVLKCTRQINLLEESINKLIDEIKKDYTSEEKRKLEEGIEKETKELDNQKKTIKSNIRNTINDIYGVLMNRDQIAYAEAIINQKITSLIEDINEKIDGRLTDEEGLQLIPTDKVNIQFDQTKKGVSDKVSNLSKNGGSFSEIGKGAKDVLEYSKNAAKPKWYQKIFLRSKTGGKGTKLAKPFSKILGKKSGIKVSEKIGSFVTKLSKYANAITAAGVALDVILIVGGPVAEDLKFKKQARNVQEYIMKVHQEMENIKTILYDSVDRFFDKRIEDIEPYDITNKRSIIIKDLLEERSNLENIKYDIENSKEEF